MEKVKTELIMLGTGYAMATRCYNTCFALKNGEEYFLVDAGGGNGILNQLDKAAIPCTSLRYMFVTHAHTDHVLGAVWIIRKVAMLISNGAYTGDFTVYCHREHAQMIALFCKLMLPPKLTGWLGCRIVVQEVSDGEAVCIPGMDIRFFDIASLKMKQFGFRAVFPDGTALVCLGDEPYNGICHDYAAGCDWLLCEAFCLYRDREKFKPYEKHHSTALDAGKLAEMLGVKNLLLYHTEDTALSQRKENYGREARSVFSGRVFVPDDLDRIIL